MNMLQERS